MKVLFNRLINHETISREEARQLLVEITRGAYNESQIAAFLTVYMMRRITLEELEGFRDGLLELCVPVDLRVDQAIDLCGTGGDGKDTFNISTLASFVTAGAGIPVAKHGNYGVSSGCGSSNVMEHLGIRFSKDPDFINRCIEEAGICFLHAALFHPAMKEVAPVRKNLGVKTFFNMLGPMVNPSFPKYQVVGVFNLELARMYGYLYQNSGKDFSILHALDGYDEISLTGKTKWISRESEGLIGPEDFGVKQIQAQQISGGSDVASAAEIFESILNGQGTEAQNHVVCANAAAAIHTVRKTDLKKSFATAKRSLETGEALRAFNHLKKISQQ